MESPKCIMRYKCLSFFLKDRHLISSRPYIPSYRPAWGLRTIFTLGEARAPDNSLSINSELFFNDPTCYEMETFVFQSCLCAVALLGRKERGAIKSSMCSTCPWKRPASCTVLSGLFSCSYVLLMYLFHSRVSLSAGISNSLLISFSIVSANRGRQGDRLIDWLN